MPQEIFGLTEQAIQQIQRLISQSRQFVGNTQNRQGIPNEPLYQSTECYMALVLEDILGIQFDDNNNAIVDNGQCGIYQTVPYTSNLTYTGQIIDVYNSFTTPISQGSYCPIIRDKFGTWWFASEQSSGETNSNTIPFTTNISFTVDNAYHLCGLSLPINAGNGPIVIIAQLIVFVTFTTGSPVAAEGITFYIYDTISSTQLSPAYIITEGSGSAGALGGSWGSTQNVIAILNGPTNNLNIDVQYICGGAVFVGGLISYQSKVSYIQLP